MSDWTVKTEDADCLLQTDTEAVQAGSGAQCKLECTDFMISEVFSLSSGPSLPVMVETFPQNDVAPTEMTYINVKMENPDDQTPDDTKCKLNDQVSVGGDTSSPAPELCEEPEQFCGHASKGAFTCIGPVDRSNAKGAGREGPQQRGRGKGGGKRTSVSNEIRATLVNLVLVHGMSMREAGQKVQPNLSRFTVASIVRTFRQENRTDRRHPFGGRPRLLSEEQENAVVNMAIANNVIRLREIQNKVIEDQDVFRGIDQISIATIDRILQCKRLAMKQAYRVPFERNSENVKDQRLEYVQRIMELEATGTPHEFIFFDEAGFNLTKRKKRVNNIIGHRAVKEVPGQRGGNITLCAAISHHGVLHQHATLGLYNTGQLVAFLSDLRDNILQQKQVETEQQDYIIVWDNVSFHHTTVVNEWFTDNPRFSTLFLPTYSPFLNPLEEFFPAWRWKVFDRNPYEQGNLLQALEEACSDITLESIQGWTKHTRDYFPLCLSRTNIVCDVDEVMWPDQDQRQDPEEE